MKTEPQERPTPPLWFSLQPGNAAKQATAFPVQGGRALLGAGSCA